MGRGRAGVRDARCLRLYARLVSQRVREVRRQTGGAGVRSAGRGVATLEPRLQRLLDLQRTAGNAAVVQLVGEEEAASAAGAGTGAETADANADDEARAKAVFDKGAAAYDAGDFAHAADFFARAFEIAPRPGILFSQGQALRRLGGRRDEAISCYEDYLASGHGKRDTEAKQCLKELQTPPSTGDLEKDTAAGKSIFERGAAYYEKGDFAHAYDEFTRSWELTLRPGLLFSRAQALRKLGGRREEAIDLYQEYIDSGETNRASEAKQFINELQVPTETGDLEKDTAIGKSIFDRGAAYYEKGDFAHAYDEFSRSWELTQRPQLQFSRAQSLRRLGGRTDEAIDLYQDYIDSGQTARAAEARQFIDQLRAQGAVRP